MPEIEKATAQLQPRRLLQASALDLIVSGRKARDAFNHRPPRIRQAPRPLRLATPLASRCLLARRLVEAGTRVVEVIWPKVANSDNHSWDHARRPDRTA